MWTVCTSGAAITKAGVNANATIVASGLSLGQWSEEAESYVAALCRKDISGLWTGLTTTGKSIVSDIVSSHIAEKIIMYDPDALSRSTATIILNVLENNIKRGTNLLQDDKYKTYLKIT